MANVTDPLARHIHGTNPQNLIEYITRQKIYDSQYWKEECFGLSAVDITEKAALQIKAVGGSFGGNSKPTRFLCLVLKMLQIQPEEEIVEELVSNEDFKYVRALGAFYLRLTGRPADIYTILEPLLNDYRPLRRRDVTEWTLTTMDEFVDDLLRQDRVCGISLPRLPKREVLEESGYLEGPRRSALFQLMEEETPKGVEDALAKLARDGNVAAREALEQRGKLDMLEDEAEDMAAKSKSHDDNDILTPEAGEEKEERREHSRSGGQPLSNGGDDDDDDDRRRAPRRSRSRSRSRSYDRYDDDDRDGDRGRDRDRDRKKKKKKDKSSRSGERKKDKKKKKEKSYGTLFKSKKESARAQPSSGPIKSSDDNKQQGATTEGGMKEGSDEYWNTERAKLGLAPLKK